ncbi:GH16257 [Drosophila grimshawi]|uniref:GH16257 n=1 Tax=Drosophila grimshawi TaxID=7222 RepID=B4IXT6_DROGR|nr:GH16257 [Drosophila grimshawi]
MMLCTASALGSGLLLPVQAQPTNMDAFGSGQQFEELSPTDYESSMLVAVSAVMDAEAAGDSNEIDNSYAAAGAAAAGIEADIGFDADADVDADAVADDVDVEKSGNDYVIAMGQGQNTTKDKNERAEPKSRETTASPIATTNGRQQLMNAKTQDLLSLSQLSSHQASTLRTPAAAGAAANVAQHEKSTSSLKNSISSNGGTFQQIGSQRINGNVPETTATIASVSSSSFQQVTSAINGFLASPTPSTASGSDKSHIRTSAKKVESRYVLPKQQKTDAPMLNYIFDTFSSANKHHHHDQRYGPHFEDVQRVGQPTNMTVQAGSSIHLNCRISLLQDKTVSWVRRNTLNEENALDLLTVGLHAYTGDKRYKMEFQYPNNWRLKIGNVKKDDEATYECQISTHPPRVIQINLHVNAPKVMIVDEYGDPLQEKYYEIDSTLQLSCVVRNVAMTSSVVFWKHSENVLNYDVTRGGVSVKTELMEDGANSTLSIAKIHKADSGNYTCSISEYQNFTIVVHILNGESFAELHHGGAGVALATWQYIIGLYFLLLIRWIASSTVFTYR